MKRFVAVLISSSLIAMPAFAENSKIPAASKPKTIQRSRSGGSAMADTVTLGEKKAESQGIEDSRAMLAPNAVNTEEKKVEKRRIPLSRSGGSPSAAFVTVPK